MQGAGLALGKSLTIRISLPSGPQADSCKLSAAIIVSTCHMDSAETVQRSPQADLLNWKPTSSRPESDERVSHTWSLAAMGRAAP
jgi:hypothetical protein